MVNHEILLSKLRNYGIHGVAFNRIEKVLENKQNTSFIHHENISTEKDFYDNKHLNERGVKFFAKNIKGAYFNTKPKKMPYIRKKPNPYPTYKGNIPQHT